MNFKNLIEIMSYNNSTLNYEEGPHQRSSKKHHEEYDVSVEKIQNEGEKREEHEKRVIDFTKNALGDMGDGDCLTVKYKKCDNTCQTIRINKGYTRTEKMEAPKKRWSLYTVLSILPWTVSFALLAKYSYHYGKMYLKKQ